ncbi:RNA polymerase sigma-70 factor (ECF subfamily) [Brevundimonas nasdae]|uniref:RNA polymerase sigma factor n=1 Tax=Brevundimonas nasdae TaxID=172043 RepID=UPI0019136F27|nr:sigma-70 family RNA polymerase sigma factor [Brevundimonas nasdae]MBK6026402.1 sigma-70 family RNA polymerase sigma factor [Brevundimonas nasdae]MDQ0453118.1 RNA polymerase sigma-70 factor (ECF subfamily) [Brevundimonas nasdae]
MGRDQSFEALLSEHGAMLRRIASGYEADRERRRELEQEILLAVWRAVPKHRGEAPLRAFIARVAHNRAVTHVAREAAEPRRQPLDEAAPSNDPTPHDAAETRDMHQRLEQAVRALPLPLRQPALLTLEGFAPAEIAEMLDLNANAVSIRLTRAKAALREALNPAAPAPEVRP